MLASPLALRVAARYVQAAYFKVNDIVLMGKYKNKRGKIVSFGADKWGNPTVEVEPIPKGRKQNKVFGLFKIWRADVKENVLKQQAEEAARLLAEGQPSLPPIQNAPVAAGPLDLDDDDEDDDGLDPVVANVVRRVLAQRRAALEYGYGAQGSDLTQQAPFPLVTPCVKCGGPARHALSVSEEPDGVSKPEDQMYAVRLHANNPHGDREGELGFWFHDLASFATYLCADIDCGTATTLWNQA